MPSTTEKRCLHCLIKDALHEEAKRRGDKLCAEVAISSLLQVVAEVAVPDGVSLKEAEIRQIAASIIMGMMFAATRQRRGIGGGIAESVPAGTARH